MSTSTCLAKTTGAPTGKMPRSFLGLPGEVRNEVYAYALVYPYGLQYRIAGDGVGRFFERVLGVLMHERQTYTTRSPPVVHLQQVNRQLRNETRLLELRYNELHFNTFADLAHFINNYPKQYFEYLDTIHVARGDPITSTALQDGLQIVKEFCAEHPHMTVRAHDRYWWLSSVNTDILAIAYQSRFRGSLEIARKLIEDDGYMSRLFGELNRNETLKYHDIELTTETRVGASPLPTNLRICVYEEDFQERKLQEMYRARQFLQLGIMSRCQGGWDQWIKVIKQVFEEGI